MSTASLLVELLGVLSACVLGLWVVFGPHTDELFEMVWSEYGPVSCQVVEVVHDDRNEQVDNLYEHCITIHQSNQSTWGHQLMTTRLSGDLGLRTQRLSVVISYSAKCGCDVWVQL